MEMKRICMETVEEVHWGGGPEGRMEADGWLLCTVGRREDVL